MHRLTLGLAICLVLVSCTRSVSDLEVGPLELICNADQSECQATLGANQPIDGSAPFSTPLLLKLSLHTPSLPAMTPLVLGFTVDAVDDNAARSEFNSEFKSDSIQLSKAWVEGRDMFMGEHVFESKRVSEQGFELSGMIPVCITGSDMVWRFRLALVVDDVSVPVFADVRSLAHLE